MSASSSNQQLSGYQSSLLESIQQVNSKFDESIKGFDIESEISKARAYQQKLLNIKRDMTVSRERSAKLRTRALKLQEEKQRAALDQELKKDRIKQREKQLSPVVRTSSASVDESSNSSSTSATVPSS